MTISFLKYLFCQELPFRRLALLRVFNLVWTMSAITLATITPFEMKYLCKYYISFGTQIVILLLKFIIYSHCANFVNFRK